MQRAHDRGAVHRLGLAHPVPALRSCSSPSACSSACGSWSRPAFQQRQGAAATRGAEADRRRRQDAPARGPRRDGHAHRRERRLLHLHRVRPGLRPRTRSSLGSDQMLTGVGDRRGGRPGDGPLWGSLSDRFGRKKLYMAGAVFSTLFAFPFFTMVDTKETVLVVAGDRPRRQRRPRPDVRPAGRVLLARCSARACATPALARLPAGVRPRRAASRR